MRMVLVEILARSNNVGQRLLLVQKHLFSTRYTKHLFNCSNGHCIWNLLKFVLVDGITCVSLNMIQHVEVNSIKMSQVTTPRLYRKKCGEFKNHRMLYSTPRRCGGWYVSIKRKEYYSNFFHYHNCVFYW